MADTNRSNKRGASAGTASGGLTEEERAAIKERARELKAAGRSGRKKADDEQAVLDKIAEMPDADRALAERVHAVITATAPGLRPRPGTACPRYARDGNVVCFFQGSQKFPTTRDATGHSALVVFEFSRLSRTEDAEGVLAEAGTFSASA
jgi:uncharacterized protein YdhG (YjbR/CyaY superfamily)